MAPAIVWPASAPPLALGLLTAPTAGWPKAVASGRGVRRVVLPPGGRAGQVVLAMGACIYGNTGLTGTPTAGLRRGRRPSAKPDRLHRGVC